MKLEQLSECCFLNVRWKFWGLEALKNDLCCVRLKTINHIHILPFTDSIGKDEIMFKLNILDNR